MAGMFTVGEIKVRPGAYSNLQKVGENTIAGSIDGTTAVLFRADWGPLNKPIELSPAEGYEKIYGTALTTDIIEQVIKGGASKIIACRIGSGGSASSVSLMNNSNEEVVRLTSKYEGAREFTVTVKEKLSDPTQKECIIHNGTREFEKVEFSKGPKEADNLVAAFSSASHFVATAQSSASSFEVVNIAQAIFTGGTNSLVTAQSYSDGFSALEAENWNTICVDTEDTGVHILLASFLERIFQMGQLCLGVVAEKRSVDLEDRMSHAATFNSEKMHYIVNPAVETTDGDIDGYKTAARIAGMIAACPSNRSLTHTIISGVVRLNELITPTQIIKAETMGCIVLTTNSNNQIWIDSAINTLVTPNEEQDEGWKKIRRTKTRYELVTRAVTQADNLVGKVDNDANGRATIVGQVQGIGTAMVEEGKLISCKVKEGTQTSEGDTCYFDIDAIDKDSAERIYLTFKYRFSTNV